MEAKGGNSHAWTYFLPEVWESDSASCKKFRNAENCALYTPSTSVFGQAYILVWPLPPSLGHIIDLISRFSNVEPWHSLLIMDIIVLEVPPIRLDAVPRIICGWITILQCSDAAASILADAR